jgi:hypothetical protein
MDNGMRRGVWLVLRVLVPAALVVDAIVHLHLAHGYQQAQPGGIGEGTLFRLEAVLALVSAAWVLIRGSRASFVVAFLVALTAVAAAVLYRYVNVPAFGPIPSMYEPIWFGQKTLSAIAEANGAVLAAIGADLAMPAPPPTDKL